MSPEVFWQLSLRELWNEHEAHAERMRQANERSLSVAWHTENFRRHDPRQPLPSLKSIFYKMRGGTQGSGDMVQALHAISAQYGLKVTVKKHGTGTDRSRES